jgi:hypothetical protein
LVNGPPGALGGQLEAVDEGNSSFGRKSTCKADHAEPVTPTTEVPSAQLLAMQLMDVGFGLAVIAGFVTELTQV